MAKAHGKTHTEVHNEAPTSDGEPRPNHTKAAPSLPPLYSSMSESARVGALNDYGTMINEQLVYWGSTITPPLTVIDRNAAYSHNGVVKRFNDMIMYMNAACAEFGILTGPGQQMQPYSSLGYNAFVMVLGQINAQLAAMQAALP